MLGPAALCHSGAKFARPRKERKATNGAAHASEAGQVNGLSVATDRSAAIEHELHATFADQGVIATITFVNENQADRILGSFKAASR